MPLTHDFKETIRARAQRDSDFRQALLREAVECIINGDLETGKAVLRDYVNATVGFQDLEKRTHIPAKRPYANAGAQGQPLSRKSFHHPDRPAKDGGRLFRAGTKAVIHNNSRNPTQFDG